MGMETPPIGTPKGQQTATDPGSQLWINRDGVTGLRVRGSNVEHDFPVHGFDRIWIGSDPAGPDARHILKIAHPSVSRRHATIEWRGPHLVVVDQGSKNGTRSNNQAQGIFELTPGARVAFGEVEFVAYNARTQRVRAGYRRFLGYGPEAQGAIERLQELATQREHLALVGESGSGGPALARYIHTSSPANTWPFVHEPTLPAPTDRSGQRTLVASAAYGTLVLDTHHRGVRFENVRHLCDAIASNAYHVRLIVLTRPSVTLEHLVGDALGKPLHVFALPPLSARLGELQRLLPDTIEHHCIQQGAAGDVLSADDVAELSARITETRRGRRKIETWDEFEENVARLVALRRCGNSASAAEQSLGMSRGSFSKWASKYGWPLNPRPGWSKR